MNKWSAGCRLYNYTHYRSQWTSDQRVADSNYTHYRSQWTSDQRVADSIIILTIGHSEQVIRELQTLYTHCRSQWTSDQRVADSIYSLSVTVNKWSELQTLYTHCRSQWTSDQRVADSIYSLSVTVNKWSESCRLYILTVGHTEASRSKRSIDFDLAVGIIITVDLFWQRGLPRKFAGFVFVLISIALFLSFFVFRSGYRVSEVHNRHYYCLYAFAALKDFDRPYRIVGWWAKGVLNCLCVPTGLLPMSVKYRHDNWHTL